MTTVKESADRKMVLSAVRMADDVVLLVRWPDGYVVAIPMPDNIADEVGENLQRLAALGE